jgi:hypothetical protein
MDVGGLAMDMFCVKENAEHAVNSVDGVNGYSEGSMLGLAQLEQIQGARSSLLLMLVAGLKLLDAAIRNHQDDSNNEDV